MKNKNTVIIIPLLLKDICLLPCFLIWIMSKLSNKQIGKYSRQIIIDSLVFLVKKNNRYKGFNNWLWRSWNFSAQYLSMAGIKYLGLVDDDSISLSNLNRQTLFTERDIGEKKVEILEKGSEI